MASEEQIKLYNEIIVRGCCKRCVLRYLGFCKSLLTFEYPNTCLVNFGLMSPMEEFDIEPPDKRMKSNSCSVCLGLLQDSVLDKMYTHEDLQKISEYGSETFALHITFPVCCLVRDHSMKLHLKRMFPNTFDVEQVIKVNHAWRFTVEKKLSSVVKKEYNHFISKLIVHFVTQYELEEEEMGFLKSLPKNKKCPGLSRHSVSGLLDSLTDDEFAKLVTVPPKAPFYSVTINELKLSSKSYHLMGNYCKYSRELLQVPQPETPDLDSIQEIIKRVMREVLKDSSEVVFEPSSHDDATIRVLGEGRTFHLEIVDPKVPALTKSDCKKIEKKINQNKGVRVMNLRMLDKRDIFMALQTEKQNPLEYKLLCIVRNHKNIDLCINAVNLYNTFTVKQKIPIRVIHQRSYWERKKKVYYIKAKKITDNLLELDLCAQQGLYLLEFVNGDMGRTTPSLSDIMQAQVEIIATDITGFLATLSCAEELENVVI